MHYYLETTLEHRSRLAEDARRQGIELADANSDYYPILRGKAEFGPSEVIDPHWEMFSDLNEFDDEFFAEEIFRENFLKGWEEQTEYLEENEPEVLGL